MPSRWQEHIWSRLQMPSQNSLAEMVRRAQRTQGDKYGKKAQTPTFNMLSTIIVGNGCQISMRVDTINDPLTEIVYLSICSNEEHAGVSFLTNANMHALQIKIEGTCTAAFPFKSSSSDYPSPSLLAD